MANSVDFTGTIKSSVITITPTENENWDEVYVSFDEGSAAAGTVTLTVREPGMSAYKSVTDGTYTVGTSLPFYVEKCSVDSVKLTPSSVDEDMTYYVKFSKRA